MSITVVFFFAGNFSIIPFRITLSPGKNGFLPEIVGIPSLVRRLGALCSSYQSLLELGLLDSICHPSNK
jgi:hypothetical protein